MDDPTAPLSWSELVEMFSLGAAAVTQREGRELHAMFIVRVDENMLTQESAMSFAGSGLEDEEALCRVATASLLVSAEEFAEKAGIKLAVLDGEALNRIVGKGRPRPHTARRPSGHRGRRRG